VVWRTSRIQEGRDCGARLRHSRRASSRSKDNWSVDVLTSRRDVRKRRLLQRRLRRRECVTCLQLAIPDTHNNTFPTLFNKCLHLSCFPDSLKIGNIILFQKGGKEQAAGLLLSSYFTLTDNREGVGETYDSEADLSSGVHQQHGFREGKSVDTAINELLRNIKTAKRDGKHVLVLSSDIKGAFDNLQHRAILKTLDASACPSNINRLFHSLLQNRKVTLLTAQGRVTKEQKQGCPQGSCSGPALWNLVANEILIQVWPDNVHIQAFADDFVLVIKADTNKSLVEDTQSAIAQFRSWCSENELAISKEKTNYILFSKMVRNPKITWNGYKINRVKSFKYLGIHVDDRLNWLEHINKQGDKAIKMQQNLKKIAGGNWGISQIHRWTLYKT
ncbi:Putative protein in type-1 retrotransposable element R1DM, partial [Araneus ventricosus]